MRLYLHIGPEVAGAQALQEVLSSKREQLRSKGVLYPRSPGNKAHTRFYMAVTDTDHIDPLRFNRGFAHPQKQSELRDEVMRDLQREIDQTRPETVILSVPQLATSVHRRSEMQRIHDLLRPLSNDIRLLAYLDDPARLLLDHYTAQLSEGRAEPLSHELAMMERENWWASCVDAMPRIDPLAGVFEETQGPAFWLDTKALQQEWEAVFGAGALSLRAHAEDLFAPDTITDEIRTAFGISQTIGKAQELPENPPMSAAWMARARQLNTVLLRLLAQGERHVPRQLWRSFIAEVATPGPATNPGSLSQISDRFSGANAELILRHPELDDDTFRASKASQPWTEADPDRGFRASQYLLAFLFRIEKATKEKFAQRVEDLADRGTVSPTPTVSHPAPTPAHEAAPVAPVAPKVNGLTDTARALMPPQAVQNFEKLMTSSFAPHNRLGAVDEEQLAAAYTEVPPRDLPEGRSGNVIVGCMKNEAPYIVEWVAYHRAMGVDNFLIYTNDCSDGTSEILDRLQDLGVLQHRNNDDWKGNSPQQYALNQALKEPVIQNADWILHIDVDEFVNVRTGNGTLQDFFDAVPDATNVAMTWRLFGHNNVTRLADELVIDQFDTCAPKFCPKPHTVWGFKTMFKNIGAYEKISCHRPNKLVEDKRDDVRWVNGSGRDMTGEAVDNGWRNSKKSIGYDLIQLNHYALRSAESYLIKRQRGRALHVDRSIGLNYWIRMDWSDFRDVTIKRNLPRLRTEYDRLMQDKVLHKWHLKGLDWHKAKAIELHGMPEFEELYQQALKVKLTETERVAYALALDLES
ncbi:glycosyltransferase family 2 protein [Tropicibacter sp. Alg240-R139]|uniref:glycosyltransferase family 2 protein n=1 Tax=Tropicibacter sp. Alg240-R139 TaxID=2305991 RepID=UPI0013E0CAD1|nr:glycosyltransferase family 2 protein [Tropicibacter sp. Alg240-R139]